jgi:riboflavin kinase/FMN adenylyltransferase
LTEPTYLTLGNFDGMHRGHCALLAELRRVAAKHPQPAQTAVLTFDPHPLVVLRPHTAHHWLTTPLERLAVAAAAGIGYGIIQPFSLELAALSAQEFVNLLKMHLNLAGLVVGPDFALGRNREGTLTRLTELGQTMDFTVQTLEPIDWEGQAVRSSVIRAYLREGNVTAAHGLLGRPYHVTGMVVEGDRRGRLLGTPTANLILPADKLWPADGVYATRTWVLMAGRLTPYWSVTNLGVRPTVDGSERRFETHLLDFPPTALSGEYGQDGTQPPAFEQGTVHEGNLYGQSLAVEFVEHLRGEIRFSGLAELQAQIQADIVAARELFAASTLADQSPMGFTGLPALAADPAASATRI